jgi:hypothetical protein
MMSVFSSTNSTLDPNLEAKTILIFFRSREDIRKSRCIDGVGDSAESSKKRFQKCSAKSVSVLLETAPIQLK